MTATRQFIASDGGIAAPPAPQVRRSTTLPIE